MARLKQTIWGCQNVSIDDIKILQNRAGKNHGF